MEKLLDFKLSKEACQGEIRREMMRGLTGKGAYHIIPFASFTLICSTQTAPSLLAAAFWF
jgi:hypothetical protein